MINKRIIICHPNPTWRQLLSDILIRGGYQVVDTGQTAAELLRMVETHQPDLLLTSNQLPDSTDCICHLFPQITADSLIQPLIITDQPHPAEFCQAVRNGAQGYAKNETEPILSAVTAVATQLHRFDPKTLTCAIEHAPQTITIDLEQFTTAEQRIMQLLAEGHSNKKIGKECNLSVNTVKTHLRHIYRKLGVNDRTQAALRLAKNGR